MYHLSRQCSPTPRLTSAIVRCSQNLGFLRLALLAFTLAVSSFRSDPSCPHSSQILHSLLVLTVIRSRRCIVFTIVLNSHSKLMDSTLHSSSCPHYVFPSAQFSFLVVVFEATGDISSQCDYNTFSTIPKCSNLSHDKATITLTLINSMDSRCSTPCLPLTRRCSVYYLHAPRLSFLFAARFCLQKYLSKIVLSPVAKQQEQPSDRAATYSPWTLLLLFQ